MKKLISLALILCLMTGACAAGAESGAQPALAGYEFDFVLRLHPDAFSKKLQSQIQDYAALLEALRFRGTFLRQSSGDWFELNLSVIPVSAGSGAFDLCLMGTQERMYLGSSLMGDQWIRFSNYSLLAFCAKMSEHLGVPLYYGALLLPYTWTYALDLPISDWQGMAAAEDENGVIPENAVKYLWDCWDYRVTFDIPFRTLMSALGRESDMEESFQAMVYEIPDYFVKQVAQEEPIRIERNGSETVWSTVSGAFYREIQEENDSRMELTLPRMQTGYLPFFALETSRENGWHSTRLTAQLLGEEEDLVNLALSLVSFPESWPMDCYSLLSLNLTGGLLPNVGFSTYLSGEQNGHVRMAFMKPTVDSEPGATMLTLEGELLPAAEPGEPRSLTQDQEETALDILVANDVKIQAFLPGIISTFAEGMLRFLVGIPTAACQTIMDDLTEMGVLDVLLGQ